MLALCCCHFSPAEFQLNDSAKVSDARFWHARAVPFSLASSHLPSLSFVCCVPQYFFDQIDTIATLGYIPSEQDVLHARAPTTGIVENNFEIDGNQFKMFDVGGQRNERKKWIHCFENVTAVLFVAALSEYNQVLYEDETQNRLVESLQLFDEICVRTHNKRQHANREPGGQRVLACATENSSWLLLRCSLFPFCVQNSRWFRETSMILFLNKRDVFAEKIEQHPLADWFPEFATVGSNSFDAAAGWIKEQVRRNHAHKLAHCPIADCLSWIVLRAPLSVDPSLTPRRPLFVCCCQFEIRNLDPKSKSIYTHITCATDTHNVTAVFSAVKDIILRKNLGKVGLL